MLLFSTQVFADSSYLRTFEKNTHSNHNKVITLLEKNIATLSFNLKNAKNESEKTLVQKQYDHMTLQLQFLKHENRFDKIKLQKNSLSNINFLIDDYIKHLDKHTSSKDFSVKATPYSLCEKDQVQNQCGNQKSCSNYFIKLMTDTLFYQKQLITMKKCFKKQAKSDHIASNFCTLEGLHVIQRNISYKKRFLRSKYQFLQAINDLGRFCITRDYNFDQSIFKYWMQD